MGYFRGTGNNLPGAFTNWRYVIEKASYGVTARDIMERISLAGIRAAKIMEDAGLSKERLVRAIGMGETCFVADLTPHERRLVQKAQIKINCAQTFFLKHLLRLMTKSRDR